MKTQLKKNETCTERGKNENENDSKEASRREEHLRWNYKKRRIVSRGSDRYTSVCHEIIMTVCGPFSSGKVKRLLGKLQRKVRIKFCNLVITCLDNY